MRGIVLALWFLLAASAPAVVSEPSGTVQLENRDSVTVAIDDGGRALVSGREDAGDLSRFEAVAVWQLTNGAYGYPVGDNVAIIRSGEHGVPEPPPIAPGIVRLKLYHLGDTGTLLVVENGYSSGLAYRATMFGGEHQGPTDVCEVMPQRFSFEHWPYIIERLEISRMRLVPWIEGQRPRCE
jgi:hypothetical protein